MRISLDAAGDCYLVREKMYGDHWRRRHSVSLLPGPVAMSARVVEAFCREPISHRSQHFIDLYQELRDRLSELAGGMQAAVICGSGTLANDAVAANLRSAFGDRKGLVIANGEFGERLIRQAASVGMRHRSLTFGWGAPWNFNAIEKELERQPAWIWAVHLETSTGVLNDLARLTATADRHGVAVAADCVSSMGAVDLCEAGRRLFMASGVSGKALGSYAGLAFLFLSAQALATLDGKTVCPTFNVVSAIQSAGPVSTLPSPLAMATLEALRENYEGESGRNERYRHYEELGRWARRRIREAGLEILAREGDSAPTIATFPLPSAGFSRECLRAGFRIAHESDYLLARRWGQIATMGDLDRDALEPLFASLRVRELSCVAE